METKDAQWELSPTCPSLLQSSWVGLFFEPLVLVSPGFSCADKAWSTAEDGSVSSVLAECSGPGAAQKVLTDTALLTGDGGTSRFPSITAGVLPLL